ncbi:LuxR C-terminal-related transcriptional regulator [Streptomyces sp. MMG1121]|uniref:LuxR C-terminal-related transcriptional regulator n=1 Tax=Streptomyces sp. MMG1121 TaxID=1415544 RepID=UPI0006AE3D04|nr:LuxR C-terminal-related transcriptional regulator [Streptomyces sp. MMG1121]
MVRKVAGGPLQALARREREVLAPMAQGRTDAAIAELLFLAESSVDKHIGCLYAEPGVPTPKAGTAG